MGLLKLSLWLQVENNKIKNLKKLTQKEKKKKMQSQIMLFKKKKNFFLYLNMHKDKLLIRFQVW